MAATAPAARPHPPQRVPRHPRVVANSPQAGARETLVTFVGMVAFVIALIVGAMVLNTQSAMLSYEIHDTQLELIRLRQDNASLQLEINRAASPDQLREVAVKEGMVPAGETGYLTLAENRIDGGEPATTPPAPAEKTEGTEDGTP